MERATQKLESTALMTTSDTRGLSTRRVTRPDRMAVKDGASADASPARGLAAPRTGLGSFGSPSGLGSTPFGG
ncbi:MAG TPA: hypothetical protein VND93_24590 [Myxococcales bacterium]|jgi:hypothetical protein|nr:hypothetical protein [Myxococcales bacterium]